METGNIVRVVMEGSGFKGLQARVVSVISDGHIDGPITVEFGEYQDSWLFGGPFYGEQGEDKNEKRYIVHFEENELRVEDDWDVTHKARYHWHSSIFHTVYERVEPFIHGKVCECEECSGEAIRRIVTNVWGVVCEYDVCEEHSEYNGCRMEILKIRGPIEIVTLTSFIDALRRAI